MKPISGRLATLLGGCANTLIRAGFGKGTSSTRAITAARSAAASSRCGNAALGKHFSRSLLAGVLSTLGVAAVLWGQQPGGSIPAMSLVTDWSQHHLVYSNLSGSDLPGPLAREPRYWQQWLRHNGKSSPSLEPSSAYLPGADPLPEGAHAAKPGKKLKRDWAVSLGPGATVGAGQYPAKFSFDVTKANCHIAPQPDFVAFNTSVAGSATQATIVAYDNLYSGCTGTVPSTYWAYNTGGTDLTSVSLSLDGTQIAFVQSSAGQAQLVLLKWQASTTATSTSPGPITVVSASLYPACAAPCMTTLTFSGTANDTNSSPFYDYSDDTLYAGDDSGTLHKFNPVLTTGAPAEVTTGGWPVALAPGLKLSSPVYDAATGRVFVGSAFSGSSGAQLFAVVGATGAKVGTSSTLGKGVGIVSGAIVDSSAGKVFVFIGNDAGTSCYLNVPCAAVYQFATNFTSGTGIKAPVGYGGSFPLYTGDFDNAYYSSANGTGNLYVCGGGFLQAEPEIYKVPITSGTMSTSSAYGPSLSTSNLACSPVTEIYSPAAGGNDRIFASVPSSGGTTPCGSGGCISDLAVAAWQPSTSYAVWQRIVDPTNYVQVVLTAGTSNASPPAWVDNCGAETSDGTVTWVNSGFLVNSFSGGWQANTYFGVGYRILDTNNNFQCALQSGVHSGVTQPVWNTTLGGITQDSLLQWRNGGPLANYTLGAAGGTSGIIMDNIFTAGILTGTSQVYFSTLGTGGCGAGNGCAVQASQSALN